MFEAIKTYENYLCSQNFPKFEKMSEFVFWNFFFSWSKNCLLLSCVCVYLCKHLAIFGQFERFMYKVKYIYHCLNNK